MRIQSRDARTYNEKVLRKMAYDRNPMLVLFADKVASRQYVSSVVGSQYLPEAYAIAEHAADVAWADLPREYAAKVNHASGGVVLVTDRAPLDRELPPPGSRRGFTRIAVHPDRADPQRLADLLDHWLGMEYSWGPGGRPEWAYQHVPRRVLVEELLPFGEADAPPADFKCYVFNGRCRVVRVLCRTTDGAEWDFSADVAMTPAWERIPVFLDPHDPVPPSATPPRPACLEEMVRVAEALGAAVDFVRVDLYALGERVVVGELTNYPSAATNTFEPASFDLEWGSYWQQDY
jgi:hypothetical protein